MALTRRMTKTYVAIIAALGYGGCTWAAVSPEEAKQLGGSTLTLFGAEKAGNKDGTIPDYTAGLPATTSPPGFKKDSGRWPTPFPNEKPLFSITAQNMDKYADKLSETSKVLLKRYPSYRMDVYPSHRTVNFPKFFLDATLRNATTVTTSNGGATIENIAGGIPFPIPKSGIEVMWNHLLRYNGIGYDARSMGAYVDSNGNLIKSGEQEITYQWANMLPGMTPEQFKKDYGGWYVQFVYNYTNPPRIMGDANLIMDNIDPIAKPRYVYSYSSSTRRVRLAPDIAHDTPIASTGGIQTYDESGLHLGEMTRFDYKLAGKREMFVVYNSYDTPFTPADKLLTPKHHNPDYVRWEPHRVWVVEATLKPGLRHIYSKRMYYFDEDWTGAGALDDWDQGGKLYKGMYALAAWIYDKQVSMGGLAGILNYDLATGNYGTSSHMGFDKGYLYVRDKLAPRGTYTPDALAKRSKQ